MHRATKREQYGVVHILRNQYFGNFYPPPPSVINRNQDPTPPNYVIKAAPPPLRCTRRGLTKKIYALKKNIYTFSKNIYTFSKNIYTFSKNIYTFSKNIYFFKKHILFQKTYILFQKTYVFWNVYICGKTYIFRKAPSRALRVREGALQKNICFSCTSPEGTQIHVFVSVVLSCSAMHHWAAPS